ncbi:hypothetical protein [Paenibacillus jilunlii]|uniref:Uncharacterized protein n=1 Tax=Paenibacillus jilunlii TaxID=682956 RepID=A0A1G9S4Y5_9BACL|nr:hypothetical protein [Paenibacillus jilunlii]KWX77767.1 hypothetical protein AML91_07020 [Paenibacillus jilunlii]SDM30628.1 hypothetical protein SAMN05216191_11160 [Paenibacillus jilunlii]
MNIVKLSYPTPLSSIVDNQNDNIDVFIELEDGTNITVVVSTPQNLLCQMEREQEIFVPAPHPEIIVRSLTHENIQHAIEQYAKEDAFWLKLLYVASVDRSAVDMNRINRSLEKIKTLNNELE